MDGCLGQTTMSEVKSSPAGDVIDVPEKSSDIVAVGAKLVAVRV